MYNLSFFTRVIIFVFAVACFSACKKDPPPVPPPVQDGGVYIINEGNYGWGNGSIDYYRFADGSLSQDIFKNVNGIPLGDVVQSMTVYNGRGYIVVNNSGKVEVVNMSDFSSAGTITGLTSPRYLSIINADKACVSDLYSNAISIVDLHTLQITGNIPLKGSTEEMLLMGEGKIWVTNTRSSFLYMVDVPSASVVDSIAVGYASHCIRLDKDGSVWVLCAGDPAQSIHASLHCIDPGSATVTKSFDLGSPLNIWNKIALNATADAIYYLNNGVWKLSISATALPGAPMISGGGFNFYGMGVDPQNETIYLSDALDYVQKGRVFRYTSGGVFIDSFQAGIIPSAFCFD